MSETREKGKADKGPFDISRRIPLAPVAAEKLQDAVRQFTAIDPILDAHIDRRGHLRVSYAASHIDIRYIEILLDKAGIARASGSWWRLKSAWYRKELSFDAAKAEILRLAGTQFDPLAVRAFGAEDKDLARGGGDEVRHGLNGQVFR